MTTSITLDPLETIVLPSYLSGEHGINRSIEPPYIPANNDLDAIRSWLTKVINSKHTYAAYKREAERILLWAIVAKSKPLSSLDMTDITEYRSFLSDPQPASLWIGKKHNQSHSDWRPFTGPLSDRSAKHADTVIGNLFKFLTEQHYLTQNPYSSLAAMKDSRKNGTIGVDRSLSISQWQFITDFLQEKISTGGQDNRLKWIRTNMIILFLYVTGLRIHEIAKAKIGDIVRVERKTESQYWLNVIGKGKKYRKIPVPNKTYRMINAAHIELTGKTISESEEGSPIIPPLRVRRKGVYFLTPLAIHKTLKEFFAIASTELLDIDPEASKKLSMASTHWLRHTHGTHAVNMDIPLTIVRDNLGHTNISTTSQYVHADLDDRHNEINKMSS